MAVCWLDGLGLNSLSNSKALWRCPHPSCTFRVHHLLLRRNLVTSLPWISRIALISHLYSSVSPLSIWWTWRQDLTPGLSSTQFSTLAPTSVLPKISSIFTSIYQMVTCICQWLIIPTLLTFWSQCQHGLSPSVLSHSNQFQFYLKFKKPCKSSRKFQKLKIHNLSSHQMTASLENWKRLQAVL